MRKRFILTVVLLSCIAFTPFGVYAVEPSGEINLVWPWIDQRYDPVNLLQYASHSIFNFLYDGLFNLGGNGFYPALAESYKISEDGLRFDFYLRKGVKFHNGDLFTAKDVKFTIDSIMAERSDHGYKREYREKIRNVEVVDDYHVRFYLKEPWFAFFKSARVGLQPIVPKGYYEKVGSEGFLRNPVGSGPFKIAGYKLGEWNRYEAFKDYWGQVSEIKYVMEKKVVEPLTRFSMLSRGEADLIGGLYGNFINDIQKSKDLKIAVSKYTSSTWIGLNRSAYPKFNDKKLRLAMSLAIDRKAIAEKLLFGTGEPANSALTPATFGYDPSMTPLPYDPAKAMQLINEGGYKGFEFDYCLQTQGTPSSMYTPQILEAVASYWEAVGLKPKRIGMDYSGWVGEMRGGRFKGACFCISSNPDDGETAIMMVWIKKGCSWAFCVPEYDHLYRALADVKKQEEKEKLLREFCRLERENQHLIPLFWLSQLYGVGPRIKEWSPPNMSTYHLKLNTAKISR